MNKDKRIDCRDEFFECPSGIDQEERKLLLQKIIDGQATPKEEEQFYDTMENCNQCVCRDLCNQHLEIKTILKAKLFPKPIPNDLIEGIKERISGSI